MGTLKLGTFTMCHKRTPSHMAYVPYVGQVQRSALTRWIDMKAEKSLNCTDLLFSIFRNVLFQDAIAAARGGGGKKFLETACSFFCAANPWRVGRVHKFFPYTYDQKFY